MARPARETTSANSAISIASAATGDHLTPAVISVIHQPLPERTAPLFVDDVDPAAVRLSREIR
jgi:hypothetical protein